MTARVLIVDDIPTNVRLLEARLTAEYFEVFTASSGAEALAICESRPIDIVLLDVMMPEMDGFEVCRRLKANPKTHHIPVLMITALDQPSDRVKGLEAGADDFLTKPVDDMQLMARVRSLVRLKVLTDELRARAHTGQQIAIEDAVRAMDSITVDRRPRARSSTAMRATPSGSAATSRRRRTCTIVTNPADTLLHLSEGDFEVVLVSMALGDVDPLRVCSQVRTLEQTPDHPDHPHRRGERPGEGPPRARSRDQRLHHAPCRAKRAPGPRAHPDPPAALCRRSFATASTIRWRSR